MLVKDKLARSSGDLVNIRGDFFGKGRGDSPFLSSGGMRIMAQGVRKNIHAADCADRASRFAFGLNDAKAVAALRQLADAIETGAVVLQSITTSSRATHEEFVVREVVVELLEEYANPGPRMVKG